MATTSPRNDQMKSKKLFTSRSRTATKSDPLALQLRDVLSKRLISAQVLLEVLPNNLIVGHIISPQFDDMDSAERFDFVQNVLRKNIRKEQRTRISTLLTYTPEEWDY